MTSTASEAASYEFTTLTCIPGVIEVSGGPQAPPKRGVLVFALGSAHCLRAEGAALCGDTLRSTWLA